MVYNKYTYVFFYDGLLLNVGTGLIIMCDFSLVCIKILLGQKFCFDYLK